MRPPLQGVLKYICSILVGTEVLLLHSQQPKQTATTKQALVGFTWATLGWCECMLENQPKFDNFNLSDTKWLYTLNVAFPLIHFTIYLNRDKIWQNNCIIIMSISFTECYNWIKWYGIWYTFDDYTFCILSSIPSPTCVAMAMTKCISYACMSLCGFSAQGWSAGGEGERGATQKCVLLKMLILHI